MSLKIFALGFILNKNSYLRNYWNILDFTIIVFAYLPRIFPSNKGIDLTVLRSLRVLRPLRTISSIKKLKMMLVALFSALPLLKDTIIIFLFFYIIFAIAGLQLFSGAMKRRCFLKNHGIEKILQNSKLSFCIDNTYCGDNYICGKLIANPNYGLTNFDNFFFSFLQVNFIYFRKIVNTIFINF